MSLSYDIARCRPDAQGCDKKETCARFTEPGRLGDHQWYMDGSLRGTLECEKYKPKFYGDDDAI